MMKTQIQRIEDLELDVMQLKEGYGVLASGLGEIKKQLEYFAKKVEGSMNSKMGEIVRVLGGENTTPVFPEGNILPTYAEIEVGIGVSTGNGGGSSSPNISTTLSRTQNINKSCSDSGSMTSPGFRALDPQAVLERVGLVETQVYVPNFMGGSKDAKLLVMEAAKDIETQVFDEMPERENKKLSGVEMGKMTLNSTCVLEEKESRPIEICFKMSDEILVDKLGKNTLLEFGVGLLIEGLKDGNNHIARGTHSFTEFMIDPGGWLFVLIRNMQCSLYVGIFQLPYGLFVQMHRECDEFISELVSKFSYVKEDILKSYDAWKNFKALNLLELKSMDEPIYQFGLFALVYTFVKWKRKTSLNWLKIAFFRGKKQAWKKTKVALSHHTWMDDVASGAHFHCSELKTKDCALLGVKSAESEIVAGVMLETTDLGQHILEQVEPIRHMFATLFLVSIGMLIHAHFLWNHVDILLASVILVVTIKTLVIYGVVEESDHKNKTAILVGMSLAQTGEPIIAIFMIINEHVPKAVAPKEMAIENGEEVDCLQGCFVMIVNVVTLIFLSLLSVLVLFLGRKLLNIISLSP